jgi:hypothetical protein
MKSLADIISECPGGVNEVLTRGLNNTFKAYGLVRTAKKGTESINHEVDKVEAIVYFDDAYTHFVYHKIKNISYEQIRSGGNKKLYNAKGQLSLICWSTDFAFHDHVINRLSQFTDITIGESDFDSYKIIKEEIGKDDFDFSKYVFVVNYQLRYQTDNCHELCP